MRRIFAAVLICGSFATLASAQEVVPPAPKMVAQPAPTVYHSGWACLDKDGNILGRVVTVGSNDQTSPQNGVTVELANRTGVVATGMTDEAGRFMLASVEPGVYSLSATGSSAFATHAVQVLSYREGVEVTPVNVYATGMSRSKVDDVLRGLFVPAPEVPPSFGSLQEPPMPIQQTQRVAMSNGRVNGRLSFSHGMGSPESHTVKVFGQGKAVDTVAVDRMGYFSFDVPGAGAYDLVVGGMGFGAVGIEVVGDGTDVAMSGNGQKFVAANNAAVVQESLMVPVSMPASEPASEPVIVDEFVGPPPIGGGFPAPAPGFAGGGFSGGGGGFGGGGGGGFGGGLGGAGGLLGVAGLAVGVAALADDDDGFDNGLATPVN